ncbi:MAG: exonuclease SbcCD subunit D [Psychrilyobacter sp.]|uniref:exonuclease SbcCD subunit D n=1 Tax=Psychrilyobacter sp. TaxID=2586924 RepID=UPI003C787E3D
MKIMHLGDLHIGKKVNGYSMIENQKDILKQIYSTILKYKVETVLIAGDIYDRSVPSEEATQLLDDFLSHLINVLNIRVIAISGNHDSPTRLDFSGEILAKQGLYILGEYKKLVNKISINNFDFYLMPFVTPATIRKKFETIIEERELVISTYDDTMKFIAGEATKNLDSSRVNIALYHGFVIGSGDDEKEIEKEDSVKPLAIGGKESVAEKYFLDFDYTALGHLHGNRKVKSERVRYAGSPIKYSFSEKNQKKSLTIIDIDKDKFDLEQIEIKDRYPMIELKGTFEEIMKANIDCNAYLKITLTESVLDAMNKLRSRYSQIMELGIEIPTTDSIHKDHSSKEIHNIPIDELLEDLAQSVGVKINSEEMEQLRNILNEIKEVAL